MFMIVVGVERCVALPPFPWTCLVFHGDHRAVTVENGTLRGLVFSLLLSLTRNGTMHLAFHRPLPYPRDYLRDANDSR